MIFVEPISIKENGVKSLKMKKVNVIVLIGAGSIGQAIARRVGAGNHILLADLHQENNDVAAKVLSDAGFKVSTTIVDISSRDSVHELVIMATAIGEVTGLIHASGHRLPALTPEQDKALATTPTEELLSLPFLQSDAVDSSLFAYQMSKRGNSLRVKAEAVRWGKRGARINTISPGIIITPLANDELNGPRGESYRKMLEISPAGRAGTPDEVGVVGALLMGRDGAFITGSDFLMDGGVTSTYWYGDLVPKK